MKRQAVWILAGIGALVLGSLALKGGALAQAGAQLPPELDTPYIRDLAQKARAEGGVINSYGMPNDWANYGGIYAEFQRLFGIRQQDIDMGSAVVLARMREEKASKNDVADLKPAFAMTLAEEGLTLPYKVTSWDALPEGQKGVGKDGSAWYTGYKGTLGWIVNTRLVKKVPRTWKELESPEYKGLIQYMDPRATGTGVATIMSAAYALSGDPYNYKAGVDFFARLHKLGVIGAVEAKVTTAKFERGEVGIFINYDYNLLAWKERFPFPTEVVIPQDGTLANGGGIVAARNAPHPNTARLFLEFIFSKYGQSLFAKAFVSPIRPDVELPKDIAAKYPPKSAYAKVKFVDYKREEAVSEALQKYYGETIR
ncbi:extracellular solute-binding protein [Thermus sp. PS18]|uniref:Extracellular solute-binding protein n=1 Tax=Thermus brevis TaxID=2862456 RepID=A0ABS7A0P8_9DEIN|nr:MULTISPECIES: extracellular solute-binding protein [Thermus]MBW6395894.1 extracellular solute-binding protein [Thermus brevis]UZX14782.1 extracellular solute-binding protein [Thermus sp. PS18]